MNFCFTKNQIGQIKNKTQRKQQFLLKSRDKASFNQLTIKKLLLVCIQLRGLTFKLEMSCLTQIICIVDCWVVWGLNC